MWNVFLRDRRGSRTPRVPSQQNSRTRCGAGGSSGCTRTRRRPWTACGRASLWSSPPGPPAGRRSATTSRCWRRSCKTPVRGRCTCSPPKPWPRTSTNRFTPSAWGSGAKSTTETRPPRIARGSGSRRRWSSRIPTCYTWASSRSTAAGSACSEVSGTWCWTTCTCTAACSGATYPVSCVGCTASAGRTGRSRSSSVRPRRWPTPGSSRRTCWGLEWAWWTTTAGRRGPGGSCCGTHRARPGRGGAAPTARPAGSYAGSSPAGCGPSCSPRPAGPRSSCTGTRWPPPRSSGDGCARTARVTCRRSGGRSNAPCSPANWSGWCPPAPWSSALTWVGWTPRCSWATRGRWPACGSGQAGPGGVGRRGSWCSSHFQTPWTSTWCVTRATCSTGPWKPQSWTPTTPTC
ncbi:hypothetical protein HRbin32_02065 [bacterium HR32]|nr:hypothetical protein HRbin32_02065 [bacterium HR32]